MQRYHLRVCLPFLLLLGLCSYSRAAVLRVKADAPGPAQDGATWATAFNSVADALALASSGDEVWVAAGTYTERITLPAGVGLYGGFGGTEETRTQRLPGANTVTLNGGRLSPVVTVAAGAGADTVLDGFTIRDGKGSQDGMVGVARGGGILCVDASPVIRNNTVQDCGDIYPIPLGTAPRSIEAGGGIYLERSSALLENNIFRHNAAQKGGAVACVGGAPVLRDNVMDGNVSGDAVACLDAATVTFTGNAVTGGGLLVENGASGVISGNTISNLNGPFAPTGIVCSASSPDILDNTIRDMQGAGISCGNGAAPLIRGNTISGNDSAGIWCNGASPTITNNFLTGNDAQVGQYIYSVITCMGGAAPLIANNLIVDNPAASGIGCMDPSAPRIINNTVARNSNGVTISPNSSAIVVNNIFAYNRTGVWMSPDPPATPVFRNNCVFGSTGADYGGQPSRTGADGNISADPLFANPAHRNYHIQPNSPCRDAGDSSVVTDGMADMDGQPRLQGARVDIGADESDGTIWNDPDRIIHVRPDGDDANDGRDWAHAKKTVLSALTLAEGRDEVWVAEGVYTGRHLVPIGVSLYGGFAGTETERSQADPAAHPTVLDGGAAANVVQSAAGTWINTTLDGFVVRNARSTAAAVSASGATVRRCVVRENRSPGISTGTYGVVEDCEVTDNTGVGVSARTVRRCLIARNAGGGALVGNTFNIPALLENSRIVENGSVQGAATGGVTAGEGAVIRNNFIAWNAGGVGGISPGAAASITNNTIVGNTGRFGGGIGSIPLSPSAGIVANNIIAYNSSGVNIRSAPATFHHNNVYGNYQGDYATLAGDITGQNGNISAPPRFASVERGNFHLQPDSPGVDAGDAAVVADGETDMDGQPRVQGAGVDMGADESDGTVWNIAPFIVRVRPDGDDAADGATWATAKRSITAAVEAAGAAGGGEVWAAGGTYTGPFVLGPTVRLRGGFAGTENKPEERDGAAVSILEAGPDATVLTVQNGLLSEVDRLTVRGGATGVEVSGAMTLRHMTVTGNGNGIHAMTGRLTLEDSEVSGNLGYGVIGDGADAVLLRNTVRNNASDATRRATGAVALNGAYGVEMRENEVRDNGATGVYVYISGAGEITDNVIAGNTSTMGAGGLGLGGTGFPPSTPVPLGPFLVARNRILDNHGVAGGIAASFHEVSIEHNLVQGNTATQHGAGISAASGNRIASNFIAFNGGTTTSEGVYATARISLFNNTIVGHPVAVSAAGAEVVNNILAGNRQGVVGTPLTFRNNCEYNDINYTATKDPTGANGNFVADPRLVRPATGNYHIQPDSPCVDAGDDVVVEAGETDVDGQPRRQGDRVDIGADESDGTVWPVTPLVLHVRPGGDDTADGLTWATAKKTVPAVPFGLSAGDEVWVAAGEYINQATITLKEGVSLYGGFAGTEARREERNPAANVTTLRASFGTVVTVPPGVTSATVLDGFTVTGGRGTRRDGVHYGGGILCDQSSPTLSNNVITGNSVGDSITAGVGGGVASLGGSPILRNNVITRNTAFNANGRGGGVAAVGGGLLLLGNTLAANAGATGAGLSLSGTPATVEGNLFQDQQRAMYCDAASLATIRGNAFLRSTAAALDCNSDSVIAGNLFDNTGALNASSGILVTGASPRIENNVVAGFRGTGISVSKGAPLITGNVIRANGISGQGQGGGLALTNSAAVVRDNDFVDNVAGSGAAIFVGTVSPGTLPVTIDANRMTGNLTSSGGAPGGVICAIAPTTITNNEITDNRSAAIVVSFGSMAGRFEILRNIVANNNVLNGASLISVARATSSAEELTVVGNDIRGNNSAAIVSVVSGNVRLWSNRIVGNTGFSATAIISLQGLKTEARNNLIARNVVRGRAILMARGQGQIVGNTVTDNAPDDPGAISGVTTDGATLIANNIVTFNPAGIGMNGGAPALRNNIVYGNRASNYRDMPDPTGTDGNLSVDPLFVDRAAGNYRLADGSPAINAGDDSVVLPGERDADGDARLLGEHVDIGAYESAHPNPALLSDAVRALRLAAGLETATPDDLTRLDAETSGALTLNDAARLLRRAIGLDKTE